MKYTFTRKQIVNAFNNKILDDDNFLTYLLSTTSKDRPMNQKSLDKKKTKELDWGEKTYKFIKNILLDAEEKKVPHPVLISQIFSLLTQQRTELLEEIKTRIDTWGGFEDDGGNLCHYDSEILEWVKNLLNKKNDQTS